MKKILYRKAYRMLNNSTPLRFDCGLLCGSRCCSGGSESGMHLLPGEEIMLRGLFPAPEVRSEELGGMHISFCVCKGKCDRRFRPLACRIFPLVPFVDGSGKLQVIEDPRVRYICPLLFNNDGVKLRKIFHRKVYRVFQFLSRDPEIRKYIEVLSGILMEYARYTIYPQKTGNCNEKYKTNI